MILLSTHIIDTEKITGLEIVLIHNKYYLIVTSFNGKIQFYILKENIFELLKEYKYISQITSINYIENTNLLSICGHNQSIQSWNIIKTLNI